MGDLNADADAQVPISVPGVQYYRYPTPSLDTPIVTPALRSPIVTQALNTPIITPALGAPPIVLPAGQDGVALRSQFLQPASLGGGVYYTPNTIYYTPNTTFKKTPEDLTKLIKAYTDLSPETKKFISERSQCQDWQKQAIVEFFENNLSIGCVKAFMQEILYENGCDQDYDYNINTKSAETDQVQTKRQGKGAPSA